MICLVLWDCCLPKQHYHYEDTDNNDIAFKEAKKLNYIPWLESPKTMRHVMHILVWAK